MCPAVTINVYTHTHNKNKNIRDTYKEMTHVQVCMYTKLPVTIPPK